MLVSNTAPQFGKLPTARERAVLSLRIYEYVGEFMRSYPLIIDHKHVVVSKQALSCKVTFISVRQVIPKVFDDFSALVPVSSVLMLFIPSEH